MNQEKTGMLPNIIDWETDVALFIGHYAVFSIGVALYGGYGITSISQIGRGLSETSQMWQGIILINQSSLL